MSAVHTTGCETCGAPVGWVSGHKLESSNLIGREFLKTISGLRATNSELLAELQQYELPFTDEKQARVEFGDVAVDRELSRRAAIAKATGGAT